MGVDIVPTIRQKDVFDSVRYVFAEDSDDPSTIRVKLAEVGGQRVVLIVSDENQTLENPIALRLVARAAAGESVSLVIVSNRGRLRDLALVEGIKAFRKVAEVPRPRASEPDDVSLTPARIALTNVAGVAGYLGRSAVVLVLLLSLAILFALAIPKAVVTVRPVTDQISGTVRIRASTDAQSVDLSKAVLPARTVYLLLDSTGSVQVPTSEHLMDGRAVGYITFENRVANAVPIPKGTDVSTFSGVHFVTTTSVTLPGRIGASDTVPIIATYPGSYANVQRGEIVVVNGPAHWLVTAVNEDIMAGGGPASQPIITAWETNKLLSQVTANARQQATQELQTQRQGNEILVPESIQVTPIEENLDHPVGTVSPTVGVHMQSRVSAMFVNQDDLNSLAAQTWHPNIRQGFVLRLDSIQVLAPTVTQIDSSSATFDVPLRAVAYAAVNADRIASYVRLRTPAAAEGDLTRLFDLNAPPTVRIVPKWMPRAYRVQVVVDTSAAPTTSAAGQP
ncbi:MAG TPA: baseplate J/gp47 family protein [Chloroflexota bacterium]|nr:baseplate J/gp47 family protein [Chloroflexota bacterium]